MDNSSNRYNRSRCNNSIIISKGMGNNSMGTSRVNRGTRDNNSYSSSESVVGVFFLVFFFFILIFLV